MGKIIGEGITFDDVLLEDQENHQDRQDSEHGTGDQHIIVVSVRRQQCI